MSIEVTCPNGHVLHVKDKYGGKAGLCPHCRSRVNVPAPAPAPAHMSDDDIVNLVGTGPSDSSASRYSVLDHQPSDSPSVSLLNSSIDKQFKICLKCKNEVASTYDLCPRCHTYFIDSSEVRRRRATQ